MSDGVIITIAICVTLIIISLIGKGGRKNGRN